MKDLSSDLSKRCRAAFLKCTEFDSDASLRGVFASTNQLKGYSDKVFEANSRERRADNCLRLLDCRRFRGEPVLALFLETLSERYPEGDDFQLTLHNLAQDVRLALDDTSNSQNASKTYDYAENVRTQEIPLSSTDTKGVDVGIVLALKEEFAELFSQFENNYTSVYDEDTHAHYYLFQPTYKDSFKSYRCVATFVGSMGTLKAGLATDKLISRWHPHTLVIMGITASLDAEVALGDVVVAEQVNMYLENSKAVPATGNAGYTFQLSPEVYRSAYDIVSAIQHMEFRHKEIFQDWQQRCAVELQQLPSHEEIVAMIQKEDVRAYPFVHIGHLASGPTVGGARAFKNWLKQLDRKYLALEMETGGFMEAAYERLHSRTLIIRAISDYGDERKKKLDNAGKGAFRRYAIHNAIRLLWSLFERDILLHSYPE